MKAESEFKMINSPKRMEYCLGNDFELLSGIDGLCSLPGFPKSCRHDNCPCRVHFQSQKWLAIFEPFEPFQQEFLSPKFRHPMDLQTNVVYKIPCSDCS